MRDLIHLIVSGGAAIALPFLIHLCAREFAEALHLVRDLK